MATATTTNTALFETKPCVRCMGSGDYRRTTCFRCLGRGYTLTKRGALAQTFYRRLCSLPAHKVQVGMRVTFDGDNGYQTVVFSGVKREESGGWVKGSLGTPYYVIETAQVSYGLLEDTPVRVAQTPEQQQQKRSEALAYQATLTIQGEPVRSVRR
jgi:hypothetical protein